MRLPLPTEERTGIVMVDGEEVEVESLQDEPQPEEVYP